MVGQDVMELNELELRRIELDGMGGAMGDDGNGTEPQQTVS